MKLATRLRAAELLMLTAVVAPDAGAQELDFVRGLFREVHSVTLFGSWAEIRKSPQLETQPNQCLFLGVCGGGAEVLWDLTPADRDVHLELGLGASYLRGFSGKPLADPFDLRASVRSFPEFGAYLSGQVIPTWPVIPYVGGTFGFSDLWNAQVYGADRIPRSIKGQTFSYGMIAGIALDAGWGGNAFFEGGYRARRFPSLDYTTDTPLPSTWPRGLDLSGWQISAGWQFELRPPKRPPAFEGVWVLSAVDSDELPAMLSQMKNDDGTSTRIEIQGGTLHIEDDIYRLGIHQKTSTLDAQLRVVGIKVADLRDVETGRYTVARQDLVLHPAAGGRADVARLGDEIVLTAAIPGHNLRFRKISS